MAGSLGARAKEKHIRCTRSRSKSGIPDETLHDYLFPADALDRALPARAGQGPPGSERREVRGSTMDKDKRPVASAVIYLQNVCTLAVTTYLSRTAVSTRRGLHTSRRAQ